MLTNRLGLPQAVVDAVKNDPYSKGDSDISVTQLIQPPYLRKLRLENEVIEDASDRLWSLMGQIGHGIVERAYPQHITDDMMSMSPADAHKKYGVVAERRLYMDVNGWKVSGQFDVIEGASLKDFKFTSVWSVLAETKSDWVNQLNLLRLLAIRNGIDVEQLQIIAILRDWSKGQAKRGDNYPKQQVSVIDIPVWPVAQVEAYMLDRVKAHQDKNPPACSDLERWKKEDVFATMRNGRKTAIRLHETFLQAQSQADELGAGHYVDVRKGEYTRCQDYCNVSHVCPAMATEVGF